MESLYFISQILVFGGMAFSVWASIYLASRLRKLLTVSDIFGDNDTAKIEKVIRDLANLSDTATQFNGTIKNNLLEVSNITSGLLIDIKNASADAYNRTIKGLTLLAFGFGCQAIGAFIQIFIHYQSK